MAEEAKVTAEANEPRFLKEALFLAESYTDMLERRDWLQKRIAGSWIYTKEMAIAELDNITVSYENERVQSSNISNPTERIALKLTDEFMARKQAEMNAEREACISELAYMDWKIEVVETVWHERMKETQRAVFQLLYYQHKTFKEAESTLLRKKNKKFYDCSLVAVKEKLWVLFEKEIEFRIQSADERPFVEQLTAEANQAFAVIEKEGSNEQTERKTG